MDYKQKNLDITPCNNKPSCNVIKLCKDVRGIICGIVVDECNKPVCDTVVIFVEICKEYNIENRYYTFTDKDGEFVFGPTNPKFNYSLKIWRQYAVRKRIDLTKHDCNNDYTCNHCIEYDNNCNDYDSCNGTNHINSFGCNKFNYKNHNN